MPSHKLSPKQYKELIKISIMAADVQYLNFSHFIKKYPEIASAAGGSRFETEVWVWERFKLVLYPPKNFVRK